MLVLWLVASNITHLVLQDMRSYKQAEEAGKKAGFKLVSAMDLAVASAGALPWCDGALGALGALGSFRASC